MQEVSSTILRTEAESTGLLIREGFGMKMNAPKEDAGVVLTLIFPELIVTDATIGKKFSKADD